MSKSHKKAEEPIPSRSYSRHKSRSRADEIARLRYNTQDDEYLDLVDGDDWDEQEFEKFKKR